MSAEEENFPLFQQTQDAAKKTQGLLPTAAPAPTYAGNESDSSPNNKGHPSGSGKPTTAGAALFMYAHKLLRLRVVRLLVRVQLRRELNRRKAAMRNYGRN